MNTEPSGKSAAIGSGALIGGKFLYDSIVEIQPEKRIGRIHNQIVRQRSGLVTAQST